MERTFFLLLISFTTYFSDAFTQERVPVTITYSFSTKSDSDVVKLVVKNQSKKLYYYSITLGGLINGEWESLLSDINSLGQNEFTVLKPIKGKSPIIKQVSLRRIYTLYEHKKPSQIRFGVMFYEKRDFQSKGSITYTSPIN